MTFLMVVQRYLLPAFPLMSKTKVASASFFIDKSKIPPASFTTIEYEE